MKKRLLASLLSLCLLVGLFPTAALAAEDTADEAAVVCMELEGCIGDTHDEDCPLYVAPNEDESSGEDDSADVPGEPDADPVYDNGDDTTVIDPEQEEPVQGPTPAEQLAELIADLPDPSEIDPLDEEQVEAVYNQISAIYAFAGENGFDDIYDNETINAVIAALNPVETLNESTATGTSGGIDWSYENGVLTISKANTPESNYTSGVMVDYNNANAQPWISYRTDITQVVISDGVETLGNYALSGASNLTKIEFTETIAIHTIGKRALEKTGLTSITIPDSVTELKEQALGENTSLTSVQIGKGLSTCGNWVFYGDTALSQVTVDGENSNFYSEDGILFGQKDGNKYHTIILYPSAKEGSAYSIPEGTVHIAAYAFQNCGALTSLAIPSTLATYGSGTTLGMFQGTKNLEQITVAADNPTYTTDVAGAWVSRDGNKIVLYPAASSGTTYTIGEDVGLIVAGAFAGAANLTTLYYNAKDASSTDEFSAGSRFSGAGSSNGFTVIIGDEVTIIPAGMFNGANITKLTIGNAVTEIGTNAFQNCKELTELAIPDSVQKINGAAFKGCAALKTLTLGKGLSTFSGDQIFNECTSLETVYYNAPDLQKTTTPSTNTTFGNCGRNSDGVTVYVGETVANFSGLWDCQYVKKLVIEGMSRGCTLTSSSVGSAGLEELVISENVEEIPANAFINNNKLKRIIFTGNKVNLTSVGTNAFCNENVFSTTSKQYILLILPEANNAILNYAWNNNQNHHDLQAFILNAAESSVDYSNISTPTRDNFNFGGWYSDSTLQTVATNVIAVGTYYAKWNSTITFDANGGTLPEGSASPVSVEEGKALSSVSESYALPTPTNGNATFVGWNTAADGSGDPVTTSTVPTGNATYYAIWGTSAGETYSIYPINEQTYTGSPITPTVYLVDKSGNKFAASSVAYENNTSAGTATAKVTVSGQEYSVNFTIKKADYDMSGISFNDATYDYDGTEKELTITGILPDGVSVSYSNNKLTDVGSVSATASFSGDTNNYNEIESKTATLTIKKVEPTISISADKTSPISGGGTVTLTVSGLPDGASAAPICDGVTVSPNSDGTYSVSLPNETKEYTFAVSYAGDENHEAAAATCTVSVTYKSSGGGGSSSSSSSNTTTETVTNKDGSTTTTITDKKTGTVTVTTKYKDGSTLVVETKKDGTVTTTETRADGVKVKTVDEPGEDVTAAVTIPRSVGTATVTIPADTTPGTVAVDTETGEIVKLSVPTEDGMTVKLDGSANLVLEDRSKNFTDTNNHWAEDAIDFATAHGMFSGTSATTFSPDGTMTRGMIAVVLHNFEDNPDHAFTGSFEDVHPDAWYADGIHWMVDSGIAGGYGNGRFGAEDKITREQLATFLYNFAKVKGYDVSGRADLGRFTDGSSVSGYATETMSWAVDNGLFGGMGDGTLAPQGNATRAQVATILMRFVENLTK